MTERSDTPMMFGAAAIGFVLALYQIVTALADERTLAATIGAACGSLVLPLLAALLFGRVSRRAGSIGFVVVAVFSIFALINNDARDRANERELDRAREALSPADPDLLATASGQCLVRRVADYDDAALEEIARIDRAPGPDVAGRLRDSVISCGLQGVISDGLIEALRPAGVPDDVFDRRCMMSAFADAGVALMFVTGNTELVEHGSPSSATDPAHMYFRPVAPCLDSGRFVREFVRAEGGPTLSFETVGCVSTWLETDERSVRLLAGDLAGLPDGVARCLPATELEEWSAWLATR